MGINMSKVCNGCKQTKSIIDFSKHKNQKDGLQAKCKECKKIESSKWRINNPKYFKDNSYKYIENNRKITQEWKEKNPTYYKKYWEDNKDKLQIQVKEWTKNNPLYMNEWNKNNPNKFKQYNKNQYIKNKSNPTFKIQNSIRVLLYKGLQTLNNKKSNKTLEIIGLESWEKLREHIEKQWVGNMNWDNYGIGKNNTKWHIDHIIPISSAQTEEDIKKLNHYTNLQPMWGSDNQRKSNKI